MASAATFSVSKPNPLTILLEGICATAVSSLAVRVWPMAKTSLTCMCSGIVSSVKLKYKMLEPGLQLVTTNSATLEDPGLQLVTTNSATLGLDPRVTTNCN